MTTLGKEDLLILWTTYKCCMYFKIALQPVAVYFVMLVLQAALSLSVAF